MNPHPAWQRLAAAARSAPDARDTAAPAGFAAGVAALAAARELRQPSVFEHFSLRVSLRVLGAAAALAVAAAGATYPATIKLFLTDAEAAPSFSAAHSPAGLTSPELPAAAGASSAEAAPSSGEDPVAEVVDAVS